jgi:hypothetical protein
MQNFQVFSKRVYCLFQFLMFALPILTILYWLNIEQALTLELNPFYIPEKTLTLNAISLSLGFILSLLPTLTIVIMSYQLSRLFKNYEMGKVFTKENIYVYQKLGYSLFALTAVQFILPGLMSIIMTFQNNPGERMLIISVGTLQLLPLIIGFVVIGITHVMKKAYHLEKEQQYII